jgi:ornithine carbamoyltransferase
MSTTNIELKRAQIEVLNGALHMTVLGSDNKVYGGAFVGGSMLQVITSGNNVICKFGIPFSFVMPTAATLTKIKITSYDFENERGQEVIYEATISRVVEAMDIVYVNEVGFTLLD